MVVAIAPKFCRDCGIAWDAQWTACEHCAAKQQRQASRPLDAKVEHRAIKSALIFYVTLLGICVFGGFWSAPGAFGQIEIAIALSAVVLVWCLISWRAVLPLSMEPVQFKWFPLAIVLSLATYMIAVASISVFQLWTQPLHGLGQTKRMIDPFLQGGFGWGAVIFWICVQPAVFEELALRGVVFGAFEKSLGPVETIMVSAMMFMVLHLSVARFPHTLALGIVAGALRYRTRSLYPCMLLHFSHNLLCVAGEWFTR